MEEPIEETYFNWLYTKVVRAENPTPSLTYYGLLRILHNRQFVWTIVGDDNRAADGVELRIEFLHQSFIQLHDDFWLHYPCSILEMLIAFARRAEFDTNIDARHWFWEFIDNLELSVYNDAYLAERHERRINDILFRLVSRAYEPDGRGGLFPLNNPKNDQREVEIWYQFCEYLVDRSMV